jgi:two-component system LytT family response regulator
LRLLLAGYKDFEVVGECASAGEIRSAIERHRPDVVFLDVRMPGGTGIASMRGSAVGARPLVVMVTAYGEHALEAFEVEAIDYLLKPFSDEAFERSLRRIRRHLDRLDAVANVRDRVEAFGTGRPDRPVPEPVIVRSGTRIQLIDLGSILWIAAEQDYVRIHTAQGEHLLRETMGAMLRRLADQPFVRIHRSTLVRVDFIREVHIRGRGRYAAVLKDGIRRNISRRGRDQLRALGIGL